MLIKGTESQTVSLLVGGHWHISAWYSWWGGDDGQQEEPWIFRKHRTAWKRSEEETSSNLGVLFGMMLANVGVFYVYSPFYSTIVVPLVKLGFVFQTLDVTDLLPNIHHNNSFLTFIPPFFLSVCSLSISLFHPPDWSSRGKRSPSPRTACNQFGALQGSRARHGDRVGSSLNPSQNQGRRRFGFQSPHPNEQSNVNQWSIATCIPIPGFKPSFGHSA